MLAEAGCSTHQIASITGHRSLKQIERYTEAANQTDAGNGRDPQAGTERERNDECQTPPGPECQTEAKGLKLQ